MATIAKVAQELAELVPEAKIAVAHGQMRERDLEQTMIDFYHQRLVDHPNKEYADYIAKKLVDKEI